MAQTQASNCHLFQKHKCFLDNKQNQEGTHGHGAMRNCSLVPTLGGRVPKCPGDRNPSSPMGAGNLRQQMLQRCTRKEHLHPCPVCDICPRCCSCCPLLLGDGKMNWDSPEPDPHTNRAQPALLQHLPGDHRLREWLGLEGP